MFMSVCTLWAHIQSWHIPCVSLCASKVNKCIWVHQYVCMCENRGLQVGHKSFYVVPTADPFPVGQAWRYQSLSWTGTWLSPTHPLTHTLTQTHKFSPLSHDTVVQILLFDVCMISAGPLAALAVVTAENGGQLLFGHPCWRQGNGAFLCQSPTVLQEQRFSILVA